MSITEELREWDKSLCVSMSIQQIHRDLLAIADRIDAEHERMEQDLIDANNQMEQLCECSIEMPVDADGGRWTGKERVCYTDVGTCIHIRGLTYDGERWLVDSHSFGGWDATSVHRHKPPTVEDVLAEFADKWMSVQPCREPEIIAEYAAKLRLAGDAK